MKITIKKYKTSPKARQKEIKLLLDISFDWISTFSEEEKKEHSDKFCSDGDRFLDLVTLENNEVVGLASLFKRKIPYKNGQIILGGIGRVCTKPKKRSQGIATQLVQMGIQILAKKKCDVVYLCTDPTNPITNRLYEKAGFKFLNKPHTYTGKSDKRYSEKDGMLAPVNSKEVFKQIIKDKKPFDIGKGNW